MYLKLLDLFFRKSRGPKHMLIFIGIQNLYDTNAQKMHTVAVLLLPLRLFMTGTDTDYNPET